MSSSQFGKKRAKKSDAESRRLRKRQKQEEDQLSNSMKKYFSGERSITVDEGGSGDNSIRVAIDICQELIDDCDGDEVSSRNDKTENIENSKNLRETTNDENIVREMVTPLRESSSMISGEMKEETERCVEVDCTKTFLSREVGILSVTEVLVNLN